MVRSSNWSGHSPFKAVTPVQVRCGSPKKKTQPKGWASAFKESPSGKVHFRPVSFVCIQSTAGGRVQATVP